MTISTQLDPDFLYPDSDGKPMADNTEQYRWIVIIKENLEILFAADNTVFIAGDLLWYPVQSRTISPAAPDVMVVFGRPKGRRGSYKQWQEDNIAPQIVFEILSPSNTVAAMNQKFEFYQTYGVEEYYVYDPDNLELNGWLRQTSGLQPISTMQGWSSPRLGIRFELGSDDLEIYDSEGQRFLSSIEMHQRAEQEHQRAEQEHQRAEQEHQRAEQAEARAAKLAEQLQRLGIDADAL